MAPKSWKAWIVAALVIGTATLSFSSPALSPDDVDWLRTKIWKLIEKSSEPDCADCGTPLLAQLVRLSFHDCVGGCDGVLDTDFPANGGLKVPIEAIEPLFSEFRNKTDKNLSRADFWALVGTIALYRGAANQPCLPSGRLPAFPSVPFLLGRKDGSSTADESKDFPDPLLGIKPTLDWGHRVFGFSHRDTVAILGAHTLGRARRYNSGFEHTWTASPDVLDNSYYADMSDADGKLGGWKQIEVGEDLAMVEKKKKHHKHHHHHSHVMGDKPKLYQWVHASDGEGLMFNSDMCLYKDIEPEAQGLDKGKVECTYTQSDEQCDDQSEQVGPDQPGEEFSIGQLVELYGRDNYKWMQDFSQAFTTMIQTGSEGEQLEEVPYLPPLSCRTGLQAGQLPKDLSDDLSSSVV